MTIIEIKQIDNGVQKRPYADHIYKWEIHIQGGTSEEEMLEFAKKYLRDSKYNYQEYRAKRNDSADVFYSGYYELSHKDMWHWEYKVVEPYCD